MSATNVLEKIAEAAFEDEIEKDAAGNTLLSAIIKGSKRGGMIGAGTAGSALTLAQIAANIKNFENPLKGVATMATTGAIGGGIVGANIGANISGVKHVLKSHALKKKLSNMNPVARYIYKLRNPQV